MGGIGYETYEKEGFVFRIPADVLNLTQFKFDYQEFYREGTCFLRPEQGCEEFMKCDSDMSDTKKTILLWGDSHAAHLYPGYKKVMGNQYNIIQRTASLCPPILELDVGGREHCRSINDFVFASLKEAPPERVVLAARWEVFDWKRLADTIRKIKEQGVRYVSLVGPIPQWNVSLPRQLFLFSMMHPSNEIPRRMMFGLNQDFLKFDETFQYFACSLGVEYISLKNIMCDQTGCVTRVGDTADKLVAWDYGHLTDAGAEFVVARFPKDW